MTNWITHIYSKTGDEKVKSGLIANNDMSYFAQQLGFKPLKYERITVGTDKLPYEEMGEMNRERLAKVKPGDNLFIQFPTWQNLTMEQSFLEEAKKTGAKIILIFWDILSWLHDSSNRDFSNDYAFKEMKQADLLMIPNEKMAKRIQTETDVKTPIVSFGIWDYRVPEEAIVSKKYEPKLVFIGTLDKTDFSLYTSKVVMDLIGNESPLTAEEKSQENLNPLGELHNEDIGKNLTGGFGVVSYKTGNTKQRFNGAEKYGHYNNPLKLSNYLACGLPVIVDSYSAHAKRVREENIGVVLDDLNDVDLLFETINEADYEIICSNALAFSKKLRTGYFTKTALQNALVRLDNK